MTTLKMVVGLGNPGRRYENNRHNIGFRAVELYAERHGINVAQKQSKSLIGQGWVEIEQKIPVEVAPKANESSAKPPRRKDPAVPDPARGDLHESSNYGTGSQSRDANVDSTAAAKKDRLSSIFSSLAQKRSETRSVRVKTVLVKPQTYMNSSGESVQSLASYFNIAPADIMVIHDHMDIPTGKLRLRPGGGAGGQNGIRSIISRLGTQDFPRLRIGVGRPPGRMDPAAYVLQDFQQKEADLFGSLADTVVEIIDTWLVDGIETAMNQYNGKT